MFIQYFALVLLTVFYSLTSYADVIFNSHKEEFLSNFFGTYGQVSLACIVIGVLILVAVAIYMRKSKN